MSIKFIYISIVAICFSTNRICLSQNQTYESNKIYVGKGVDLLLFKTRGIPIKDTSEIFDKVFQVDIYDYTKKNHIQTLFDTTYFHSDDKLLEIGSKPSANKIDTLLDVNFDGYGDLVFLTGSGAGGKNLSYDVYLFNKENHKFYKDESFCGLYNFSLDNKLKLIEEFMDNGCLDCYTNNLYKVINNKPVLMKSEYQNRTDYRSKYYRFIEYYKNGKLVSKKKLKPIISN